MQNRCLLATRRSRRPSPNRSSHSARAVVERLPSCLLNLSNVADEKHEEVTTGFDFTPDCRFSHDVTKIQTTKLLILLIFYLNEV